MAGKNLLVIDWDFFFPNPLEGGFTDPGIQLYDWGHREAPMFIYDLWTLRASSFLSSQLPLPGVNDEWRRFAGRFHVDMDAPILYADSNAWAGNLVDSDGDPFEDVWLFDAHHDAGYGVNSFPEWLGRATNNAEGRGVAFSCEDWMLCHHMQGTGLHWRWPRWHRHLNENGAELPDGVTIDAAQDDGKPLDVEFDQVFICRSGAWVPPWEDPKFDAFIESWVGVSFGDITLLGENTLTSSKDREMTGPGVYLRRRWDNSWAEGQAAAMQKMLERAKERP